MMLVKWGNSTGIRISKTKIEELNWNEHTQLRESVVDGKLVIEALSSPKYTLEQLMAGVTPENLHGEISTAVSVGNEF